jgi:hypothetical protein
VALGLDAAGLAETGELQGGQAASAIRVPARLSLTPAIIEYLIKDATRPSLEFQSSFWSGHFCRHSAKIDFSYRTCRKIFARPVDICLEAWKLKPY